MRSHSRLKQILHRITLLAFLEESLQNFPHIFCWQFTFSYYKQASVCMHSLKVVICYSYLSDDLGFWRPHPGGTNLVYWHQCKTFFCLQHRCLSLSDDNNYSQYILLGLTICGIILYRISLLYKAGSRDGNWILEHWSSGRLGARSKPWKI